MAQIVGIYAATHTPVLVNFPDQVTAAEREHVYDAFKHLGSRLAESRADTVVIVSDDHVHNFFLDNLPAFCIGAADSYRTPIEPWLAAAPRELRGEPNVKRLTPEIGSEPIVAIMRPRIAAAAPLSSDRPDNETMTDSPSRPRPK